MFNDFSSIDSTFIVLRVRNRNHIKVSFFLHIQNKWDVIVLLLRTCYLTAMNQT